MLQNPSVNLNALRNSCVKIACCSSELIFTFLYPKCERAIRLVYPPLFRKLRSLSNEQKSNAVRSGDLNSHSELDTCSYELFVFCKVTDSIIFEYIDLSS
jgi:hypothetical protein